MLLDPRHQPRPPPWEPGRRPRMTRREERILCLVLLANLLLLVLAPFAGSSVVNALAALVAAF